MCNIFTRSVVSCLSRGEESFIPRQKTLRPWTPLDDGFAHVHTLSVYEPNLVRELIVDWYRELVQLSPSLW